MVHLYLAILEGMSVDIEHVDAAVQTWRCRLFHAVRESMNRCAGYAVWTVTVVFVSAPLMSMLLASLRVMLIPDVG